MTTDRPRKQQPKAPEERGRFGVGPKGAPGKPAGQDEGPRWPGGGPKGEDERAEPEREEPPRRSDDA